MHQTGAIGCIVLLLYVCWFVDPPPAPEKYILCESAPNGSVRGRQMSVVRSADKATAHRNTLRRVLLEASKLEAFFLLSSYLLSVPRPFSVYCQASSTLSRAGL